MITINGITIAVCTRNRPDDLKRCLNSIAQQQLLPANLKLEILIIDDGELSENQVQSFKQLLQPRMKFRYHQKNAPGLLRSRITALAESEYEVILFLDDDVEIDPGYLSILYETYCKFPHVAGIGGIDILMTTGHLWPLYTRLICYNSGCPGKLSISGGNGSIIYWKLMPELFETEFLSGCNMSFLKKSLQDLQPVPWLNNYSLGEDIYLSHIAKEKGPLLVNPQLKVRHYCSTIARDRMADVAVSDIINSYYLLQLQNPNWWQCLALVWTYLGKLMICLPDKNAWPKVSGYIKGFNLLAKSRWEKFIKSFRKE